MKVKYCRGGFIVQWSAHLLYTQKGLDSCVGGAMDQALGVLGPRCTL